MEHGVGVKMEHGVGVKMEHGVGVKMEPVKVDKVISSEEGKDLLVIKGFKFRFQKKKNIADSMERWCCTNNKCKCSRGKCLVLRD
jgi:hypothetical protein